MSVVATAGKYSSNANNVTDLTVMAPQGGVLSEHPTQGYPALQLWSTAAIQTANVLNRKVSWKVVQWPSLVSSEPKVFARTSDPASPRDRGWIATRD